MTFSKKQILGPYGFTGKFYQTFKEKSTEKSVKLPKIYKDYP